MHITSIKTCVIFPTFLITNQSPKKKTININKYISVVLSFYRLRIETNVPIRKIIELISASGFVLLWKFSLNVDSSSCEDT